MNDRKTILLGVSTLLLWIMISVVLFQRDEISGLNRRLREPVNISASAFGVFPDGKDCTEKLQVAINVCDNIIRRNPGVFPVIEFDSGTYHFGTNSSLHGKVLNYRMRQ